MVDRNSAPEEFACIWQSKQVGIIMIETKEMWIHFSSSSLCFWKSVFSFWVDSILKLRVCIKLKVSWLPAFLWCMSQKSRDRVSSRSCTNSRKELKRCCSPIGHNNTKHFLCPIRSQHSFDHLEMVWWESVPRGSSACAWKLSSHFFSQPDWPPLGLRGCLNQEKELGFRV